MKTAVLYHSKCFDGTMAAAGALEAINKGILSKDSTLGYISYQQSDYGTFFSATGLYHKFHKYPRIIFVDFCPKSNVVLELVKRGHNVVVLDHHVSAMSEVNHLREMEGVELHFDMEKSGSRLSWEYFHGNVPSLVAYVEDRDLWRWELPNTKEVIAWLSVSGQMNYPHTYLDAIGEFHADPKQAVAIGTYLVHSMNEQVKAMGDRFRYVNIEGYGRGALVNAPVYPSEVCEYIYDRNNVPFVMAYGIGKDGRVTISLRSKGGYEGSVDVSRMAETMFSGGGHKNAAGGVTTIEDIYEFVSVSEPQEEGRSSSTGKPY